MLESTLTCAWKLAGTKNFRLASSKLLSYYGTNLQNPSPSLMQCIVPPNGYIFLQADQDGAEARVVAYECRRAKFRALFELGVKPHSYTALQLYMDRFKGTHPASRYQAIDPQTLVQYPEYKILFTTIKNSGKPYDVGKMVRHAKNYKMGPRTAQINALDKSDGQINLSFKQWKEFLQIDDEVFPELLEWQNEIKEELYATRTLRNLFGYPREFTGIWSESLVRDGCAFKPQSTVGTITNLAYVEIFQYIKVSKLPWQLCNNKHDSILIAVPDQSEHIEHGKDTLRKHLGRELTSSKGEHYYMKVEVAKGYNWAKHSPTNPDGMNDIQL